MIGERIKQIRKFKGLKQIDFGKRVLVSASYISMVESGKETPSDIFVKLVALEFNISYSWLKDGIGNMEVEDDNGDYFERNSDIKEDDTKKELEQLNSSINLLLSKNSSFRNLCLSSMLSDISKIFQLDLTDAKKDLMIEIFADYIGTIEELIYRIDPNPDSENVDVKNHFYISSHLKTVERLFNDLLKLLIKSDK